MFFIGAASKKMWWDMG